MSVCLSVEIQPERDEMKSSIESLTNQIMLHATHT